MLTLKAEIIKNNPMIKKKALVIIKGGLGNQLFQLSLCNKLRTMGYDVYIDYSFYFNKEWMLNNTKRELELDLENLDFKIATKKTLSVFYNLQKLRPISNYQKGHNLNISNTKFLNIFDGYWQTVENLEFSIDYVVNERFCKSIVTRILSPYLIYIDIRDTLIYKFCSKISI